jgi:hypothetical protein
MIKLIITGDFCPQERVQNIILSGNFNSLYNDFLPHLADSDLNITNLESPLAGVKTPVVKIGPNHIAKEMCVDALVYGNFNILTLSNNHIYDQGEDGLNSTFQLCNKNNIDYVGAGRNIEEASKVLFRQIKNKKLAFLNFSENEFSTATNSKAGSNPLNPVKNYYSIKSARENSDYVIVIVHGGHEGYSLPSNRMIETYRFFIDAGANIVIGHHTHCFSGHENYGGGLIFYSLGNFIFDSDDFRNNDWNYGYAVKFLFEDDSISFDLLPYRQCDDRPGIFLLNSTEMLDFEAKIKKLNNMIGSPELLQKEWEKLIMQRKNFYTVNFEVFSSRFYRALRSRNLLPGLLSKKKKLQVLSLIRCEAHRDLVIESLNR